MARNVWRDIARLSRRVDGHDVDLGVLRELAAVDRKTLELHGRELSLLRQLSETQALRITHVHAAAARIARRVAARAARK